MLHLDQPEAKLTRHTERILRQTTITEQDPGPVLENFQVMLHFVQESKAQLTNTYRLRLNTLTPLNERLPRSLQHGLTRPQQKSFPHINGLFLLLRASGLTYADKTKKHPILALYPYSLASWQTLNPTERYFTLLETWLLRGDPEIIGEERMGFLARVPLLACTNFMLRDIRHILDEPLDKDRMDSLRYWPMMHNLALLELFGCVEIQDGPVQEGEGWQIQKIHPTELGKALFSALSAQEEQVSDALFGMYDYELPPLGQLQPILQPYFPAWQRTLAEPEPVFQEGTFLFQVALDQDLWRKIAMPAGATLDDLSNAILKAYNFDYDHLYRFIFETRFGTRIYAFHPEMEEGRLADEVRIGDLPLQPGMTFQYNYDFGDNWYFYITLERIDPPDPSLTNFKIVKKKGRSPQQYGRW